MSITDKLVTKEDPFHVHKTLGIACLLSYIFRFCNYGAESDCLFAHHPEWTLPTFALHALLNISALLFHIPQRRISSGYRIWPEYRLHSFIFLSYTLLVMTTFWVEQRYQLSRQHYVNYIITMMSMAAADVASWSAGKYQSNSIRQLEAPPSLKFFFAFAQFIAKSTLMYTPSRRYSTFYFFSLIIQVNAFMMTLRRKNVFSHNQLIAMYGLLLTIGLGIIFRELFDFGGGWMTTHVVLSMACVSFLMRAGPRLPQTIQFLHNKYVIWTVMGAILNFCFLPRYEANPNDPELHSIVKRTSRASVSLVLLFAYYKLSYTKQRQSTDGFKKAS